MTPVVDLMEGDCLDLLPSLLDQSVDLVLCDLPYGTTRCAWDSRIPLDKLWGQLARIAKPGAAFVFTACQPFTSALVLSKPDWFKYDLVWEKSNATGHLNSKRAPLRAHESILVFCRKSPVYFPQMTHGHVRKTATKRTNKTTVYGAQSFAPLLYDSTARYPRSVLKFSSDKQRSSLHPTQKPVALIEWLVRTYSAEHAVVLDVSMGSGTTGVACFNTNRDFIGIEKATEIFKTAQKRLRDLCI
jgi:site-specific DNA-methyltransferase (adenine-specific)